jgi:CheY-like chemotaxis protein
LPGGALFNPEATERGDWTMTRTHRGLVVVVDDERDVRSALEDVLESEGYIVLQARDGTEALARMRGVEGPVIALIDLMMPSMSGWELISAMKADRALRRIPVVVLTARGREAVEGANLVLQKPPIVPALLEAIRELLNGRNAPSEHSAG